MKKILSLVLALAMVLSMGLIGAAQADDSDVTLRIFLTDNPTPDDKMVSDELTKYVFDKLGFQAVYGYITPDEYVEAIQAQCQEAINGMK